MQESIAPSFITQCIGLIIALPILGYFAIQWTMLEIKPPKEVFKSPLAMELVLNSLYQTGGHSTWLKKYWAGAVRLWFSLEIVSIEGSIHFYVYTPTKFKSIIQSQVYAQYPQAEVTEVEDYTESVPDYTKGGPIELWGCNLVMTGKDEVYPIKTYVEYGLDRAVGSLDEEQRIDPITPMLEFMGSIGAGEQIWFQILVRGAVKRFTVKNAKGEEESGKEWTDKVKQVIRDFNAGLQEKDAEGKIIGSRRATKGEQLVMEAIERNANKLGFDSGIRVIYLARSDKYDANRIAGVTGMTRQYNAADYNGFKPDAPTDFDFPWQDLTGRKIIKKKKDILGAYKKRGFFYSGFDFKKPVKYVTYPEVSGGTPFILSTEELATMFHLPGRVAETSSFVRIEATKAQPPTNLPI
jgi:hypothetical protein